MWNFGQEGGKYIFHLHLLSSFFSSNPRSLHSRTVFATFPLSDKDFLLSSPVTPEQTLFCQTFSVLVFSGFPAFLVGVLFIFLVFLLGLTSKRAGLLKSRAQA